MSKVLIIGSTGDIGGFLSRELIAEGDELVSLEDNELRIEDDEYFKGISNPGSIDVIFHLAAKSFVPHSWNSPPSFIETNVYGTSKVLEFCRVNDISLVYISSYVYGTPQYIPIDENHPIEALNPYALSKIQAEELVQFYGKNFGLKFNILRPFNIYGSIRNKLMLIPEIIEQISRQNEIVLKDLSPRRDYIFVDDLVSLIVLSGKKLENEVVNAGSGKSYSVREIAEKIQEVWGTTLPLRDSGEVRRNEINDTVCDNSKAKKLFNWSPKISLKKGLLLMKERS